jgi:hypothetical protein
MFAGIVNRPAVAVAPAVMEVRAAAVIAVPDA